MQQRPRLMLRMQASRPLYLLAKEENPILKQQLLKPSQKLRKVRQFLKTPTHPKTSQLISLPMSKSSPTT